ncbi:MAG TPA: formate C-acetyltransferase/glycerol dehydratase family glycyl radical enzyme, partial [bacterium]|nr:formate C-acetyltransferase/glycerol dehydratase family glycyl radical enzyme [bacterium]
MKARVARLREGSIEAKPTLSHERALLLTDFYRSGEAEKVSVPVGRALAFRYLLQNKVLYIGEDELIVGERGAAPKATPTYPEICIHSQKDLEILRSREKISFNVSGEAKEVYRDTIEPFWRGRSLRDRMFREVDDSWKEAYKAGIFTEFMEQRAPGHTVLDDKIYRKGFLEFKKEIVERILKLDFFGDPEAFQKREELKAMVIAADALIMFAGRYADRAEELAEREGNGDRKAELKEIAEICHRVPAHVPLTFREALQYYWFVHLGVITELNTWDSFNPGRLDQHLFPFYERGLSEGTLTREYARELLQSFWVKFNNQPAPPKVGITARESSTYTDFCLINIGGLTRNGADGVNECTYLI